ncbi:hypothetical protein Tco_1061498 [Tanacetum coccineum]
MDLYKLLLVQVMAASTIPVSAEENLGDPIDIRVDIIHPEPVAAVAFPAAAIVRTQAQHGEAIRGIQEHLLGVPTQEEMTALRFRADIAEAENASLRARIKTTEAIEKITRNHERQARVKIEQQLAAVQESQRQDREDFRKLKELMTSMIAYARKIVVFLGNETLIVRSDRSDNGHEKWISTKTEKPSQMTKLSMEGKGLATRTKVQKMQKSSNTEESAVKPEPEPENTIEGILNPS